MKAWAVPPALSASMPLVPGRGLGLLLGEWWDMKKQAGFGVGMAFSSVLRTLDFVL